jgi:3-oxoacyl-[acyl-carrier protein] reductase
VLKSVAIVTGASQGIGRATAIRLARDFEGVVLAARQDDELKKTAAAVTAAGAEPLIYTLDLRQPCSAETLVQGTLDRFGRIDALVNIAGAVPQIDLFEMTDAQWEDGLALKLHGARRLTIRAWDALKASKGAVVLISGSAALDPKPGFAAVATINAAIIALAKAFAEQGIKDGVQVNSVVPGAVMTGRRRSFLNHWAPEHGMSVEDATKQFPEKAGIARYGEPEEIAGLMAYLVSHEARWLTGASVRMNDNVQNNSDRRRTRDVHVRYGFRPREGATSRNRNFPWKSAQHIGPRHDLQAGRWTIAASADELQDVQWSGRARGVDRCEGRGRRRELPQEQHRETRARCVERK